MPTNTPAGQISQRQYVTEFHPSFGKIYLPGIAKIAQPFPQATTNFDFPLPDDLEGSNGLYITGVALDFQPNTNQSGVVFYTADFVYTTDGTTYTSVSLSGTNTTATLTTAGTAYRFKPTVTPFVLPNTARNLALRMTPTGAAGTFYSTAMLTCRVIIGA